MTRYAYTDVNTNKIVDVYSSLPESWQNYSNFNLMSQEDLKLLGWKPVVEPTSVPEFNPMFDTVEMIYTVGEDVVLASYKLVPYDPVTEEDRRNLYLSKVRDIRGALLQGSDWAVLPDMIDLKGEQWKSAWATYRQQLRDFPLQYQTMPLADLPLIDNIAWPSPPSL